MATQTAFLSSTHQDLLTSLAFNTLSPHLLATSSIDSRIRIHARPPPQPHSANGGIADDNNEGPSWEEVASFKAHEGPVLRVRWAEGEWGDLLASCGSDGTVRIWDQASIPSPATPAGPREKRWQQRACLVDARGSVRDLAFAPADFGLRLATVSADGCLRLYDCPDPSEGFTALPQGGSGQVAGAAAGQTGLATWNLLEVIEPAALPLNACSSATMPSGPAASGFSSYAGASAISLGGATQGSSGSLTSAAGGSSGSSAGAMARAAGTIEADGGWSLSWCKETWYGECLAVATGASPVVRIFHFTPGSSWTQPLVLQPSSPSRSAPVSSLDWAPGSGRSYQLVAAGYRDGSLRIWKVWPPAGNLDGGWRSELTGDLSDHVGTGGISRVEWNLTGTVLSSAGDDGRVRLWKSTYAGEWRSVATIACDEDPRPRDDGMLE